MAAVAEAGSLGLTNIMHYEIEITQSEPTCTAVVRGIVRLEELSQFVHHAVTVSAEFTP